MYAPNDSRSVSVRMLDDKPGERTGDFSTNQTEHNTTRINRIYHVMRGAVLVRVAQNHKPSLVQGYNMAPGQSQANILKEGVAGEPKEEEPQEEERFGAGGKRVHKLRGAQKEEARMQKLQEGDGELVWAWFGTREGMDKWREGGGGRTGGQCLAHIYRVT